MSAADGDPEQPRPDWGPDPGNDALTSSARPALSALTVGPRVRPRLVLAAVSALAFSVSLPATAMAGTPAGPSLVTGATTATLVLQAPEAQLGALASAHGITRSDRRSRLATSVPSAATRSAAVASAAALGLTVESSSAWSVVVHGKASSITRLARSGRVAGASLSVSPSLVPAASSVVLGGGRQLDWQPASLQQPHYGADFRAAYTASSASPPVGASRPIIATLQFSGWNNSGELAVEAANLGLPAPAPSVYTAVSVDGAAPNLDDGNDGSGEVALDQESIYATNPYADQRAYFAGSTVQNEIDAYNLIATDALSSRGIMALSISWDVCEHDSNNLVLGAQEVASVHAAIAKVVAAGVTIFAASGDDGATCYDGRPGVSFPASDPLVVAVGGTTLMTPGPVETAWGAVDNTAQSGFSGSGGGQSVLFPRPAYQATAAPAAVGRELPDIAADGDPATGFPVYHDDGGTPPNGGPGTYLVGGTSLSSPISAALMVAELGSRGITTGGVGDIHTVLYSAPAASFRDITVGSNNGYTAGPGFDMVTGLGAPNWQLLVNQLVAAPTVSVPPVNASRTVPVTTAVPGGQTIGHWVTGYGTPPACGNATGKPTTPAAVTVPTDGKFTIWAAGYTSNQTCVIASTTTTVDTTGPAAVLTARLSSPVGHKISYTWTAADALSSVATVKATVLRNGKPVWSAQGTGGGSVVLPGKLGSLYQLVVVATDSLGNASTMTRTASVAFDDRNFALSGTWARAASKSAFGGSVIVATRKGAAAHLTAYGSTFTLLTRTCSTCGAVGVYVDGKHVRDVSLYSKATRTAVSLRLTTFTTAKAHKIVVVARGTKPAHSKGSAVFVDGLLAT
ncbi:hypothetical protein acdb102_36320 [Acidothermaceae bacterium B102]|nr:hypothetical protein acdb102_36320 [Acidothermaceae bacterium B102]